MRLPINPTELLESNLIEKERLELKNSFNPEKILHSICAFANDFNNWGGGYIVLGVKDNKELSGLNKLEIDSIMKKIVEISNKIQPTYYPVTEHFEYKNKHLLILYCPGGSVRPYKAPKTLGKNTEYKYYIRHASSTVVAKDFEERELIGMSNQIPFDDRINHFAEIDDLDDSLIKSYLKEINLDFEGLSKEEICKSINIVEGSSEYLKPKNIGLLMFSNKPKKFIKTPWIEITLFFDEVGDKFEEKTFEGNIISQIKNSLDYIKTKVIAQRVQKIEGQAESLRYFNYPYQAIEEALVNAVYHKSYEIDAPIEIRIELDRMYIISYPGPLPPLNKDNLNNPVVISKTYRNRRIGDFLKEYKLTEGKNTGFKKIRKSLELNGSPKPEFITDDERVQFITKIKIHKDFLGSSNVDTNVDTSVDTKPLKRQNWIISYLKENKQLKSTLIQSTFKISREIASRDLNKLIDDNKIVKKGAGNNIWYELK